MAGFPQAQLDVNSRAGQLALTLRDTLLAIRTFKAWLDSKTDPELTALGFSAGDVTLLRNSYTDLDNLAQVSAGLRTQGSVSDFMFNAKKLLGVL